MLRQWPSFHQQRRPRRYLGPDYGDENAAPRGVVLAAQLPALARQSFPLCMKARRGPAPAVLAAQACRMMLNVPLCIWLAASPRAPVCSPAAAARLPHAVLLPAHAAPGRRAPPQAD
jgi:hypothetical protein